MIRGSEIGARFDGATLESYEVFDGTRAAFEACQRMAKGEAEGVVLISPVGLGKTHLLVAMAREYDRLNSYIPPSPGSSDMREVPPVAELIEKADVLAEDRPESPFLEQSEITKQVFIEYWTILDLMAELIRDVNEGGRLINRVMNCTLLIIDELGREKVSDFTLQQCQRIIDHRYRTKRPLVVATNLDKRGIVRTYGENTISRWIESCVIVTMSGDDYRKRKGQS